MHTLILCSRQGSAAGRGWTRYPDGVTVRFAPLEALAESISAETDLVAFSIVQSSDGRIADHAAICDAARAAGARTFADLTQSLGWLPVEADGFDFTVCHAYKWLCAPRGTAFLTVREGLDPAAVHRHDLELANAARTMLGRTLGR